jgi:hypothetical protein
MRWTDSPLPGTTTVNTGGGVLSFVDAKWPQWDPVPLGDQFSWFAALLAARLAGYQGA